MGIKQQQCDKHGKGKKEKKNRGTNGVTKKYK